MHGLNDAGDLQSIQTLSCMFWNLLLEKQGIKVQIAVDLYAHNMCWKKCLRSETNMTACMAMWGEKAAIGMVFWNTLVSRMARLPTKSPQIYYRPRFWLSGHPSPFPVFYTFCSLKFDIISTYFSHRQRSLATRSEGLYIPCWAYGWRSVLTSVTSVNVEKACLVEENIWKYV